MRLILKLIAAPFVVLLTVLVAVLLFLISYPVGGVIYLVIAFLFSPYGLQAGAGAVITGLDSLNLSLRQFITS
ncbi:hypothetical protein DW762_07160 [Ruminococcus sp. AM29-19LB]|jgi:uncharacterized membrane protein|nr:hypothetical protein DWX54_12875 [Ruminococcus sp. AF19-4LB]RGH67917.1 hypothetical protein DW772_12945 [Ruminococcus sp. AM29-5AC]RGH71320.1 hypothetical protein DW764_12415 [Ruminococcus sp. AM29-1LB]RGH77664.1 hypothetical protein DW762_07160 [Ruminococcus sp. AM29-19LB]RGH77912.1 hypothetical protein DW755_12515 [Ruminococcus sp. AM29-10LB]RGH79050.1 hypothetical protein DW752_12640 [Ruminococcus sp. AM29-1]RGI20823.1 hypothetical protein DXC84_04590 [Ruminococcus sp. TF08-4]